MNLRHPAPKAGALPTALHLDIMRNSCNNNCQLINYIITVPFCQEEKCFIGDLHFKNNPPAQISYLQKNKISKAYHEKYQIENHVNNHDNA